MAWNTEVTQQRLQQAATVEFAAYGLAGTTMERIATRAGINKERLYNYFGNKERLFAAVLATELTQISEAVPIELLSEIDIGEFAGRVFDYHAEHPHLVRLMHWEALAYGSATVPDETTRIAAYRRKADGVAAAQRAGTLPAEPNAPHLYFLLISLAVWWFAVPQIARMLTGADDAQPEEHARRRAAITDAARRLGRCS